MNEIGVYSVYAGLFEACIFNTEDHANKLCKFSFDFLVPAHFPLSPCPRSRIPSGDSRPEAERIRAAHKWTPRARARDQPHAQRGEHCPKRGREGSLSHSTPAFVGRERVDWLDFTQTIDKHRVDFGWGLRDVNFVTTHCKNTLNSWVTSPSLQTRRSREVSRDKTSLRSTWKWVGKLLSPVRVYH